MKSYIKSHYWSSYDVPEYPTMYWSINGWTSIKDNALGFIDQGIAVEVAKYLKPFMAEHTLAIVIW